MRFIGSGATKSLEETVAEIQRVQGRWRGEGHADL